MTADPIASWPCIREGVVLTIAEPGRYIIEVSQPRPAPASLELQRLDPRTRCYTTIAGFDRDGSKVLQLEAGKHRFVLIGAPLGVSITVTPTS